MQPTTATEPTKPKRRHRRRARNGDGSCYRDSNGTWVAQRWTKPTAAGGRRRVRAYGPTEAQALERVLRKVAELELGLDTEMLVETFMATKYLPSKADTVRVTTKGNYEAFSRLWVVPFLGKRKLAELTPLVMEETLIEMAKQGATADIRRKWVGYMRSALRRAVAWGLILKNPLDDVVKPRSAKKPIRFLTRAEITKFLDAAHSDRLFALYVTAIATGLRQGELFGLQTADVDLERGFINVRYSLADIEGELTLQPPKTRTSTRRVDIDQHTIDVLREHVEKHPPPTEGRGAGFVFTSLAGLPLRRSNLIRRSFSTLLRKTRLGKVRFHDLRHTHASLLLAEGVHPKVVQERLGHAGISMTMDLYSHLLPSMQGDAVTKLGPLFTPTPQAMPSLPPKARSGARQAVPPALPPADIGLPAATSAPDDDGDRPGALAFLVGTGRPTV
ncbi:MAG: tyrosine-type recombinase/integrase [Deltaproteobacteria bacterium]|nr:tyrosine-type recombinase/integrase [Deltaproteobacteria bacterium]